MNKISALIAMLLLAGSAFAADLTVNTAPEIIRTSAQTVTLNGKAVAGAQVTWQTSNGAQGAAVGAETWEATSIPVAEGNTTIIVKSGSSWVAVVVTRQAATPVVISSTFCGICQ